MYKVKNNILYLKDNIIYEPSIIREGDNIPILNGNVLRINKIENDYISYTNNRNNENKILVSLFIHLLKAYYIM